MKSLRSPWKRLFLPDSHLYAGLRLGASGITKAHPERSYIHSCLPQSMVVLFPSPACLHLGGWFQKSSSHSSGFLQSTLGCEGWCRKTELAWIKSWRAYTPRLIVCFPIFSMWIISCSEPCTPFRVVVFQPFLLFPWRITVLREKRNLFMSECMRVRFGE